jgi:hypothetical protein
LGRLSRVVVGGDVVLMETVGWIRISRVLLVHVVARPLVWAVRVALPAVLSAIPPILDCIVAATL